MTAVLINRLEFYFTCFRLPDCDDFQIVLSISVTIVCSSASFTKSGMTVTPSSFILSSWTSFWCKHFWPTGNVLPLKMQKLYCWIALLCSSSTALFDIFLNLPLSSHTKHFRIPLQPHSSLAAAMFRILPRSKISYSDCYWLISLLSNQKYCYISQVQAPRMTFAFITHVFLYLVLFTSSSNVCEGCDLSRVYCLFCDICWDSGAWRMSSSAQITIEDIKKRSGRENLSEIRQLKYVILQDLQAVSWEVLFFLSEIFLSLIFDE